MKLSPSTGLTIAAACGLSVAAFAASRLTRPAVAAAVPPTPRAAIALNAEAAAAFGSIKGRLVWGGSDIPETKILVKKGQPDIKDDVCKTEDLTSKALIVDPKSKGIGYAFAYLFQPKGSNPEAEKALLAKNPQVVIDQVKCEFVPFATALHTSQKVLLKSSDPVGHNVHTYPFGQAAINTLIPPMRELETKFMPEKRPIPVKCDIHPWMESYLMVFDHPFFAVTAADGSFEITGVPVGEQKLVVWQSKVGYATTGGTRGMSVMVEADKATDVGEIKLDPAKVRN
jgi:hypothetical protein